MREKIKLAVFDLDGTLLDPQGVLQQRTADALRSLDQAGITVMINSGRVPSMARAYFYEAGIDGIFSCANGAYFADSKGTVLYRHPIPPETLEPVVDALERRKMLFYLMTDQHIYSSQDKLSLYSRFSEYEKLARKYGLPFPMFLKAPDRSEILEMQIFKIAVLESDEGRIEENLRFLKSITAQIAVTQSSSTVLDVTATGTSKGAAVRFAVQYLGIDKKNVCCVGDYDNDVSMFREAGLSIAMENATETAKAAADFVTGDHRESGVIDAVNRYMLHNALRSE